MQRPFPKIVLVLGILFLSCRPTEDQVCFERRCYEVEIVKKREDLARGLQFRKFLPPQNGMLFVFAKRGIYPFWMKDTLIPLDIIWLDENKQVIALFENVSPCLKDPCPAYNPGLAALYVLELNAGQAGLNGIQTGSPAVFIGLFRTKENAHNTLSEEKRPNT